MPVSRQDLWSILTGVLREMLEEKGLPADEIVPTATMEELGLSSIDTMHVMILLEDRLQQRLNFRELVNAGDGFVHDLTITEFMEQLHAMMAADGSAAPITLSQTQPA